MVASVAQQSLVNQRAIARQLATSFGGGAATNSGGAQAAKGVPAPLAHQRIVITQLTIQNGGDSPVAIVLGGLDRTIIAATRGTGVDWDHEIRLPAGVAFTPEVDAATPTYIAGRFYLESDSTGVPYSTPLVAAADVPPAPPVVAPPDPPVLWVNDGNNWVKADEFSNSQLTDLTDAEVLALDNVITTANGTQIDESLVTKESYTVYWTTGGTSPAYGAEGTVATVTDFAAEVLVDPDNWAGDVNDYYAVVEVPV